MKMTTALGTVLCAATVLMATNAAKAAFSADDLILNFEASAGTGSSTDLEIDLGNFSTSSFSPLSLGSLLSSTYGSSWDTDGDVSWEILGTNNNNQSLTPSGSPSLPGSTIFASTANGDLLTQAISQQHPGAVDILSLYGAAGGTAVSGFNGVTIGTGQTDAFTYQYYTGDSNNALSNVIGNTEVLAAGTTSADLYEIQAQSNSSTGGSVTDLNTFTLASNGQFTAAVPEPSTWATMIVGAASLLAFRRRRA